LRDVISLSSCSPIVSTTIASSVGCNILIYTQ
jgi:hypothetical protein